MHIITGEIRKDVYTQIGNGNKGPWTMFAVEMSERYKDKDGNTQYTNYRATFFANERQAPYYEQWLQKGKVISVSAETLAVQQREHNGNTYTTLVMNNPRLAFFQSDGQQGGGQQQQQRPQQQQQKQRQSQNQGSNTPPMNFDYDIPFAPVGLQYGKSRIYAL